LSLLTLSLFIQNGFPPNGFIYGKNGKNEPLKQWTGKQKNCTIHFLEAMKKWKNG